MTVIEKPTRIVRSPVNAEFVDKLPDIVHSIDGTTLLSVSAYFKRLNDKLEKEGWSNCRLEIGYKYDDVGHLDDIIFKVAGEKIRDTSVKKRR